MERERLMEYKLGWPELDWVCSSCQHKWQGYWIDSACPRCGQCNEPIRHCPAFCFGIHHRDSGKKTKLTDPLV